MWHAFDSATLRYLASSRARVSRNRGKPPRLRLGGTFLYKAEALVLLSAFWNQVGGIQLNACQH